MQQLFLTSEVAPVAADIASKIKTPSGKLRTVYITTPIEKGHEDDDLSWHHNNKASMIAAGFDVFEYTITGKTYDQLAADLADVDVIYVEGGSLVHMLDQCRRTGFDRLVVELVQRGVSYVSTSAGSFLVATDTTAGWSVESYFIDDFDPAGLGLVDFVLLPHWGSKEFADYYPKLATQYYHTTTPMIVLTDGRYVWVQGEDFRIV